MHCNIWIQYTVQQEIEQIKSFWKDLYVVFLFKNAQPYRKFSASSAHIAYSYAKSVQGITSSFPSLS